MEMARHPSVRLPFICGMLASGWVVALWLLVLAARPVQQPCSNGVNNLLWESENGSLQSIQRTAAEVKQCLDI